MSFVLALDQGTTSSRAIVFDHAGAVRAVAQREFRQIFPQPGWVEHDPTEIWATQSGVMREALAKAGIAAARHRGDRHHQPARDHGAVGPRDRPAARQRDRLAGPAHRAAVRRAARGRPRARRSPPGPGSCSTRISPAPSSSGCSTTCPARAARAERGELAFGTIDTLARLESHRRRACTSPIRPTRAARCSSTSTRGDWDDELLALLDVPRAVLPQRRARRRASVRETLARRRRACRSRASPATSRPRCSARPASRRASPRTPTAPAASCCSTPAREPVASTNNLLTTIAWAAPATGPHRRTRSKAASSSAARSCNGCATGSGSSASAHEIEALAASVPDNGGVYLVPAFAGLGAPHWDPYARGAVFGLTRGTPPATSRAPRSRRSPSRAPTCSPRCRRMRASR